MNDNTVSQTVNVDTHTVDAAICDFDVFETNTTFNFDSNNATNFDSPKITPRRNSENLSHHGEPRLYMSNDLYISSLLASNSYSYSIKDEEERQNSLKILGKPRCWTDSVINSDGEAELSEIGDSDGWTMQTPIRKLDRTSTSKNLAKSDDSEDVTCGNVTLGDLFRNLCIAAKRVSLRCGVLLFQPASNLIRRMTKHNFTLTELRQMLYICPEIISVRWIRVNSQIKKMYPKEYPAFTSEFIFDLKISLKINGQNCSSSSDFSKALEIFTKKISEYDKNNKTIHTGDTASKIDNDDGNMMFKYPLAELPEKPTANRGKLLKVLKTPTRLRDLDSTCQNSTNSYDLSPSRLSSSSRLSSLRAAFKLKCDHETFAENTNNSYLNVSPGTPRRGVCETPKRSATQLNESHNSVESLQLDSPGCSVQFDLLDTPGMKRIKLAALQRELANKDSVDNVILQLDVRWLIELIHEMIVNEEMTHVISINSLHKFIICRCNNSFNRKRLDQILKLLQKKYPNIFNVSVSTLDGCNTLTLSDDCIRNPKILQDLLSFS